MSVSLLPLHVQRAVRVRKTLPITPWAMLRVRNEHSQAFRGRYSPETSPWGVEILESQYWQHVRFLDLVAPPQIGKTFHACELPTLYDITEGRETVFYMNGSADNALNIWSARWIKTLRADAVLREQLLERMEGGRWDERHFRDGGLLYSAGPESAVALSQRESRIVRCSELEKTKAQLGNEASSYALARDRAAAYPGTSLITSDCTVTVREGLTWIRFRAGDRSRPFIPCARCGHYALPAHERHLDEPDLALTPETVHLLEIPALSATTPTAARETARLLCGRCQHSISNRELHDAQRAVVWVPVGCQVVRHDTPASTPIPRVRWLDELRAWAGLQLADPDVVEGLKPPSDPPKWSGPRLPDGIELAWSSETPTPDLQTSANLLPAFRPDPRRNPNRSFWLWRIFAPKYTIGEIAEEIVAGDVGELTGDQLDDYKQTTQKCFVMPYKEIIVGTNDDVSENAVLACISDLPRGALPENTIAITTGIDVNEDYIRAVKRAWTSDGTTYLMDHAAFSTGKLTAKDEGRDFYATRTVSIFAALDRAWAWLNADPDRAPQMTYIDSGFMSDEIYEWCGGKAFKLVRPCKGFGGEGSFRTRRRGDLYGRWSDNNEKRALECTDARRRPLKHQFYDPKDHRMLMSLHADHWKKEVHNGLRVTSVYLKAKALKTDAAAVKPWFFLHTDLRRQDPDGYVKQLIAERWEEWRNPKTDKLEYGWREYFVDNHFLDCEAYAFAAAALLGMDVGIMSAMPKAPATAAASVLPRPMGPRVPKEFRRERF